MYTQGEQSGPPQPKSLIRFCRFLSWLQTGRREIVMDERDGRRIKRANEVQNAERESSADANVLEKRLFSLSSHTVCLRSLQRQQEAEEMTLRRLFLNFKLAMRNFFHRPHAHTLGD
jgi:hypothetical protein